MMFSTESQSWFRLLLERVMHFDRDSPCMDAEMERTIARHSRAHGMSALQSA
jgi:hypothetical protein